MVILVAVNERERAKTVVPIAHDLATAYGDDLIVLHVVRTEEYRAHVDAGEDVTRERAAESAAKAAQRVIERTIDGDDGSIDVEPRGRVGDVADETLAEAADVDPRYLVISGRRRSPTGKAMFGSATQEILLNADCPVVTKMSD